MKVVIIVAQSDTPAQVLSKVRTVGTHLDAVWLRCDGKEVRLNPHGLDGEGMIKAFNWFAKPAIDTSDDHW